MPTNPTRLPKYRHYKPKDLAVVRIDGHDTYLGKYESPESHEKYRRLLAEWLGGNVNPAPESGSTENELGDSSINDLILGFWTRHAVNHYRRSDGSPTGELDNYRDSLKALRSLYGRTPAVDFGPLKLKVVRQSMIDSGLSRSTINQRVGRIVRLFKWAASEELIPATVFAALRTVAGLTRGRSAAKEPPPIRPVTEADVDAVKPHVARQVWAMIELQRLTGMRPGEVVTIRTCDLETANEVWIYTPERHKTEHHGQKRSVFLGPRAKAILQPWLRLIPTDFLFQPREAMAEYRLEQRRRRMTPLPRMVKQKTKKKLKSGPGERYSPMTYCHAVHYGCRRANIPLWHPNQLRHSAATRIRKQFNLEAAQVILGHKKADVTQIYAERDSEKARGIMAEIG